MPKNQQKKRKKTIVQKRRSRLWRWFVPGEHNSHRPMVVRWRGSVVVAALLIALQFVYNVSAVGQLQVLGYATNISPGEVIGLMNTERQNKGKGVLTYNSKLTKSATAKAKDVFANDYWAHVAPDGKGPEYFIQQADYSYASAGENLAKGFQASSGVVAAWMASQGHEDNVLGDYKEVGVAVMDGVLGGEKTTLVVAHYGKQTEQRSSRDEEGELALAAANGNSGGALPASGLGIGERVGIVLGTNWAVTISVITLLVLLGISALSHYGAWQQHKKKHGFKFHWPMHVHHSAHIALVAGGIGFIFASIVGKIL